jgi:hypothetical protein
LLAKIIRICGKADIDDVGKFKEIQNLIKNTKKT